MNASRKPSVIDSLGSGWPRILRLSPRWPLLIIGLWLLLAWSVFLAIDIFGLVDPGLNRPAWMLLFNDRPVEWTQWLLLALAAGLSGYVAGRLDAVRDYGASRFFLLLAIGFGLMLIEDAGDIRHVLNNEVARLAGGEIFGIRSSFMVEAPYFLALSVIPVYALARYGRFVWHVKRVRPYLLGGFMLYGLAAAGSALSNLAHSYVKLGGWFDNVFLGGQLEPLPGRTLEFTHFLFFDSTVEETIELLGLALLLSAVLAFTQYLREHPPRS